MGNVRYLSGNRTGMGEGSLFLNGTSLTLQSGTALGDAYGAGFLDRGSIPLVSTRRIKAEHGYRGGFFYCLFYKNGFALMHRKEGRLHPFFCVF